MCGGGAAHGQIGGVSLGFYTGQCFPATFDNADTAGKSKIIPAVEGLLYPYMMGERQEVAADGPNGEMIQKLRQHRSRFSSRACIDPETGGWDLSNSCNTTWQSKVYLNQYIAENVLGLHNPTAAKAADTAHLGYQVLGARVVGWTCQFTTKDDNADGCRHYPRGVTSALWWLAKPEKP